MTGDVWSEHQTQEMFNKIGRMLGDYRKANNRNFAGLLHLSITDMQAIADVTEARDSVKYNRPLKRRKIGHGDQARLFGVRILADKDTPIGCVGFDQS